MAEFKKIAATDAPLDKLLMPFETIGNDWMLITAGNGVGREDWNTMTASWGSFGIFWSKKTVTCVIRPTRHTFKFVESEDLVVFSFFDPSMKKVLQMQHVGFGYRQSQSRRHHAGTAGKRRRRFCRSQA